MAVESSELVAVEGQLRLREFLGFNYWFMWRRSKVLIALVVFGGVVYPLLAVAGAFGPSGEELETIDWRLFIWPSVAAVVALATYISAKRAFATNKLLSQPVRFTFTSSGVEANGPLSSGNCKWEGIQLAEETGSMYLLWLSKQQAYILPKRYFADQAVRENFRTLVVRYLGPRAKLRSGA